jgi:hypothetical protein
MFTHPFHCVLMASGDTLLDDLVTHWLAMGDYAVERVLARGVLEAVRGRARPAVVIRHLDSPDGDWAELRDTASRTPEVHCYG